MTVVDGVEDSLVHAIVAKCCDRVFVAVIFNLVFDKEEYGPEVVVRFLRVLLYAQESAYVWEGGWI